MQRPSIEAAIIEGNRAKNPDRHVTDYDHRARCMDVLMDAAGCRIKQSVCGKYEVLGLFIAKCPRCGSNETNTESKTTSFCRECGQALNWGSE